MTRDRQAAMLERLRAKGLGLAPHMVDGRLAPKRPAGNGGRAGRSAEKVRGEAITHEAPPKPAASAIPAGTVFEFTIPAPCEFLNANRDSSLHWSTKGKRVKQWRTAGRVEAGRNRLPKGLGRVRIDAYVIKPIRNRFDPANWSPTSKACLDGLIDYGLTEDDNTDHVEGPFMHDGGKGEPALRIVVTVLARSVDYDVA